MDDKRALELYKVFRDYISVGTTSLYSTLSHYLALIAAILAGSLVVASAAISILDQHKQTAFWILLAIGVVGPGLNITLCWLAARLSRRCYQIFLESITIVAKLEPLIGLTGARPGAMEREGPLPFPDDQHLVPDRWLCPGGYPTSKRFVQEFLSRGSHKVVRGTFLVLGIFHSLVLLVAASASILALCGVWRP